MRKIISTISLIAILVLSLVSCKQEIEQKNGQDEKMESKQYNYDTLQALFISISENTSVEDIEKYISDNNLKYTLEHYNGGIQTYNLAYTEDASLQSYADSGDYIEITFVEEEPYKIRYAQYVEDKKVGYSAIYYNHGVFWDFSDSDKMDGDYTGYYVSDSFGNDEGITIKYTNGNETKTNYFKYKNAEEVIQKVIDYKQ